MTPDERERLAVLESRFDMMEKAVAETQKDVKSILAFVNQGRGGWKTIVAVAGAAGAVGALLAKVGITFGSVS